jgi:hypothetical protein
MHGTTIRIIQAFIIALWGISANSRVLPSGKIREFADIPRKGIIILKERPFIMRSLMICTPYPILCGW